MKRLHLVFGVTALVVFLIGMIHGGVSWIVAEATWDPMATSFPAWAAFVLTFLCYSFAGTVILLAWLTTWLIVRGVRKKRIAKEQSR